MDPEPKPPTHAPGTPAAPRRDKGIRIFSYPKLVFMLPTLIVALICWIGMWIVEAKYRHDERVGTTQAAKAPPTDVPAREPTTPAEKDRRFSTPQNVLAMLFLGVFAFNLLMMGLDFPRFTIVAIVFLVLFGIFFFLWLGAAFDIELLAWIRRIAESVYATANSTFYLLLTVIMTVILGVVYLTRWLDYWEIMPNEILHHHGPLSDLERYPTTNLKFDKEIPDVLEHMFLGAGRLVLHVADEKKAIVLENVLFINTIENALKSLMSRMEVRVTTDKEVSEL